MRTLGAAIDDVGAFTSLSAEVLVAGVASPVPERLDEPRAVPTRPRWLRTAIRDARTQEHGKPTVGLHVTAPAEDLNVRRLVVAGVAVNVVPIHAGPCAPNARTELVQALRPVPLRLGAGVIALPGGTRRAPHNRLLGASEVPSASVHDEIISQRCHLRYDTAHHRRNASATRAAKMANGTPRLL